jgi:hypothetical protein
MSQFSTSQEFVSGKRTNQLATNNGGHYALNVTNLLIKYESGVAALFGVQFSRCESHFERSDDLFRQHRTSLEHYESFHAVR